MQTRAEIIHNMLQRRCYSKDRTPQRRCFHNDHMLQSRCYHNDHRGQGESQIGMKIGFTNYNSCRVFSPGQNLFCVTVENVTVSIS
ncbi:hypothetical protein DPMN_092338 [Dreissena polymorpha]|uniref:Uncharacterized protein n=1 Tax=Dreissena polymorpha TaxID=45954 RepID=A0A9D4L278_DREPO|nr:hypothetical protein DPMN_092338 [Dreissena polymorpha]